MNLQEEFTLKLNFKLEKGFGGGFRSEWISGKSEDLEAGFDSGAGLGNPIMTFWIQPKNGKKTYYSCNLAKVFEKAVESATK